MTTLTKYSARYQSYIWSHSYVHGKCIVFIWKTRVCVLYSGQGRTQVFKKVSVVTFKQQDYPVHTLRVSLCVSLRESWEKKWNQ